MSKYRNLVSLGGIFWGLSCLMGAHAGDVDVVHERVAAQDRMAVAGPKDAWPGATVAPKGAPNILVVLLDDVGYAAASTFGGPVATPGMDALAAGGLRYNNFHVSALCSPTRASLLTGRNDHRVGFGTVSESASRFPGYNAVWPKSAASIAEVLKLHGYSTAAFGKWHNTPYWEVSPAGPFTRWPTGLGFEYFYGFMAGAMDHFDPVLWRNTTLIEPPRAAAGNYNLGSDLTDQAIAWLDTQRALSPGKPWFVYYAPGATHEPHQPPMDWIDTYRHRFDGGWDQMRERIFDRQKKLGFIPSDARLTPRPPEIPAWSSLTEDEKKLFARQMEVFAAFLAFTDHEVGRLIDAIRTSPGGENTLILYIVSDNGASGEGGIGGRDLAPIGTTPVPISERVKLLEELGRPQLAAQYSAGWAWAMSSPFKWMKQVASHLGGTSSPLIVSWPAKIPEHGGLRQQFTHVNDVASTLYEVVGIEAPKIVNGVEQLPMDGVSFAYTFTQREAPSRHQLQIFEQMGSRAIYHDGWWAGAMHAVPWEFRREEDFSKDRWELYNLKDDFSQTEDLAARYPEKLQRLRALFEREARANNIFPLNNSFARNGFGGEQPRLLDGHDELVFAANFPGMPSMEGPDFNRSHRITADLTVNRRDVRGTIVANGGNLGGFVLYVRDGYLVYEHNYRARRHQIIRASERLPEGRVQVSYEYDANPKAGGGIGSLYVNGELVAQARLEYFEAPLFTNEFDLFTIGRSPPGRISDSIEGAFPFTGELEGVRVTLK
ncbi:MAG: hypothetical protein CMLOHMNK_00545 [Steroidobacteraceae bacterium]|nr:hypothetical protein [Steroidobacteraceae bacterium]